MSLFKVSTPEVVAFTPLTIFIDSPRALQVLYAAVQEAYCEADTNSKVEGELEGLKDQLFEHGSRSNMNLPDLGDLQAMDSGD